ncbi:MAG: C25 family cysteine peptidase [candidate division WOR-3 bacterium]
MRSVSVLILLLAVSFGFAGNVTQTFSYSSEALKLSTENGYTTVRFAGYPHIDKLGAPDLPVVPAQIVVPATAEVTGIEVLELREEPVPGTHLVMPVQYPQPYMENPPQFPFVEPNPSYYGVDGPFPAQAAELVAVGTKSGYRLAALRVFPVRYNPVTRTLSVVTRLVVRVNYTEGKVHVARRSELQIALHGNEVKHLVLNPQDVDRFAPPIKTTERASAFLPAGTYEHVILTHRGYRDSLVGLRDWRTRQGWRSRIVEIDSVCATYPGVDTADKMRNFLKDAETTWSTVFCFIARKDWPANQFRRAYGNVSGYPVENMPSDMYFSCLDGSWNADGDNIWGEPTDSVDCYADIHVGMITLDGVGEMQRYLAKVFRYEFTPDTGWFCKALLGNDVTFSNEFNDSIANATPTPPWFDLKMYTTGGMVTPSVQRYVDSLQSGYPITAVIAHGNIDLYGMGGNVTSPIMNALTNVNKLSMITAVCCHTGEWDATGNTNGDCIAENMAFHAPNGFIGVMKNVRYGWVRVAEYFNYSICYGLLGFRTPRRITQGEALSFGKDYWYPLVAVTTDTSKFRYEAYERTLFGEPAVPIWTGRAFTASVTKPAAINIGSGIPVNITVTDGTNPVDSAMVCLVKGEETFARGFTDGSGQVTLLVSPLTPGMMQLTVTGANNYPYLDSIVVMAAGKFVSYLRSSVNDSVGGNGDGIINPGESFRLPTWVKNYGTQTANNVTGRLITHTAGVTVTDSIKSFGNVAGGDSACNSQGFGLSVATGLPNGYAIPCSLVCKDNLDSTWVSYLTLRVGAPVLSFVAKDIRDSLGRNPNGKLDPNETADLLVTIRNAGLGNAYNVRAVLRSGDSRLTVPDSEAVYGTVLRDSNATNHADHFTVTASSSIPMETPIPCTLDIYADAGYFGTQVFTIIVGEIRICDPIPDGPRQPALYWAYDDVDSTYTECPQFSWIEIRGRGTRLTLSDDQTVVVSLPTGFGARYYNQNYTQVSICGNGWVAFGSTTNSSYTNTSLPTTSVPMPTLFINWDDIYPPTGGGVWYYHDTTNHCFIVEWDSVAYYSNRTNFDKYQIIIYDTTMAAADGNSEILFQYLTAVQPGTSATVGIQDPTQQIAIQCIYDGTYTRGVSPWIPGHAIKFTTDAPSVGFAEPELGAGRVPKALSLTASPNPVRRSAALRWQLPLAGRVRLSVYDVSGRVVRVLAEGAMDAGTYFASWDGKDETGRSVAAGTYLFKLETESGLRTVKSVLLR